MKHSKKILALAMSVAVVASIAAAGTLAWLTGETGVVTNQFNVGTDAKDGSILVGVDEDAVTDPNVESKGDAERTGKVIGNTYKDIMPGDTLSKTPNVYVKDRSQNCYMFVAVKNPNATALEITGWNEAFTGETNKVATVGDYVVYFYPTEMQAGDEFQVFTGVNVAGTLTNETLPNLNGAEIQIAAFAIQADNMTAAQAKEAGRESALAFFAGENVFGTVAAD